MGVVAKQVASGAQGLVCFVQWQPRRTANHSRWRRDPFGLLHVIGIRTTRRRSVAKGQSTSEVAHVRSLVLLGAVVHGLLDCRSVIGKSTSNLRCVPMRARLAEMPTIVLGEGLHEVVRLAFIQVLTWLQQDVLEKEASSCPNPQVWRIRIVRWLHITVTAMVRASLDANWSLINEILHDTDDFLVVGIQDLDLV